MDKKEQLKRLEKLLKRSGDKEEQIRMKARIEAIKAQDK